MFFHQSAPQNKESHPADMQKLRPLPARTYNTLQYFLWQIPAFPRFCSTKCPSPRSQPPVKARDSSKKDYECFQSPFYKN